MIFQDRSMSSGISRARENFQQAAGALHYLNDNFSNAPSTDMQTDTLNMLTHLMLVSFLILDPICHDTEAKFSS